MEATILRSDAWKIIDSGQLFSIGFVTADRRRGTGGQYIEVKNWAKVKQKNTDQDCHPIQIHTAKRDIAKDPAHSFHKTFNIFNPGNVSVHIHKVHYRLFDRFNGKTVIQ